MTFFIFYFFLLLVACFFFFFFNDTATTEIYTLSLHDALPIWPARRSPRRRRGTWPTCPSRSEEHTSELQSRQYLVCRLLLEKKKKTKQTQMYKIKKKHTAEEKYRTTST